MKSRKIVTCLFAGLSLIASAQQISPIAKAMLDGYSKVLSQNPKDYQTLYERGAQYYSLSEYEKALLDITKAIEYTPSKEQHLLNQEYSLLADIRIQEGEYNRALEAIDKALAYSPDSYSDIYKKGNICLYLNEPEEAYRAFSQLQRFKSRSQEAYFGMAKARILQGKTKEAETLMSEAEKADPGNWLTYCRLGDLSRDMKDNRTAAMRYISAFALAEDSSRPLESLLSLGSEDYPAVSESFNTAISQTKNRLPLYFLKANIANRSGAYADAEIAFAEVLADPEGRQPGVYASYAESLLAMNKVAEAVSAAEQAASMAPTVTNYALLSKCLLASGDTNQAALTALKAYAVDGHSVDAMKALIDAQIASGNNKEALSILNELIMTNPEDIKYLAIRGDLKDKLGDLQGSRGDFQRGANMESTVPEEIVWIAYCKNRIGRKMDADALIEGLSDSGNKNTSYSLAAYYATTGNLDKARTMLGKAVGQGYENLFNLKSNTIDLLNVAPLR